MSWYKLEVQDVFDKLQIKDTGLTEDMAQKRLLEYGPNLFTRKDQISKIKILLHQFYSPLIFILLAERSRFRGRKNPSIWCITPGGGQFRASIKKRSSSWKKKRRNGLMISINDT